MKGELLLLASTNFQPLLAEVLVAGSTLSSVDFLNQRRGLVPAAVFTPVASVMVALSVSGVVQMVLVKGV